MQALAAVATLLSFAPHGNQIDFRLDHGVAELVWSSPSTFRFRRTLDGPLPTLTIAGGPSVAVRIEDAPDRVRLRSEFLDISILKHGALVDVRRVDGTPLVFDVSEPHSLGAGVTWERKAPADVRYYGLGPRSDKSFDARGKTVMAEVPFLVTTAGYGEYHPGAGTFRFDFTAGERYTIRAPSVDYYFHFGPTIKQIFEEHKELPVTAQRWLAATDRFGSWETLRTALVRIVHGAMSAMTAPSWPLAPYTGTPPELQSRARQLGSLVDDVSPGVLGLSGLRKQLETFFATYAAEANEKGFPVWHPLPFQFPEDAECNFHTDEFMLGDEMLIAPILQPGGKRSVYLPRGNWTNLETNQLTPGKQTIEVETSSLPVFARNGTIVPLDAKGGMALHYFPSLGAEFFLLEADPDAWTQVHAAPAADIVRLEIEAKKARDYQWVVHHVEKPADVSFEGHKYTEARSDSAMTDRSWFYDAGQKNLHVRVHVAAGEDCIINLTF